MKKSKEINKVESIDINEIEWDADEKVFWPNLLEKIKELHDNALESPSD